MQQDNMNKSGLAVEKTVKATWSTPKIEVIDVGSTAAKDPAASESDIVSGNS